MSLFKRRALSFIIVLLLAAGCLALPAYFINENARGLVIGQVSKNAIDIAASVAAFIVKDIEGFEGVPVFVYTPEAGDFLPETSHGMPEDTVGPPQSDGNTRSVNPAAGADSCKAQTSLNDAYLHEITALLNRIKTETGAAGVYIEKRIGSSQKGFISKPDFLSSQNMTSDMTEEELRVFNEGIKSSSDVLSDDRRGEYLKGYAPIINTRTDQPIGLVVVEFLLSDAVALMANVSYIIIGSFSVIFVLVIFVVDRLLTSRAKYLFTDYLTMLSNKRYFERRMVKVIEWAGETRQPLSLMMIDIDNFKSINDMKGHTTGDDVLKAVSATLQRCTRRSDSCCRFGGDEFAIILPRTTGGQAAAIAERIRREASGLQFDVAGKTFGITLSIGIAEFTEDMTEDTLLELADRTMYVSKTGGKNRTTVYGWSWEAPPVAATVPEG
jgi:diguanylate cyclase (GGDEF)-like protein